MHNDAQTNFSEGRTQQVASETSGAQNSEGCLSEKTRTRFWKKVAIETPDKCWLWTAAKNEKGYGVAWVREWGNTQKAHRVAWHICNGPISENLCALHRCDVPACCNPHHLFLGDRIANNSDMRAKGRDAKIEVRIGEQHPIAKLTDENVREIRAMRSRGIKRRIVASRFRITESNVKQITAGNTWRHLL